MANILIEQDTISNIANAIRAKNGLSTTYTPAQMVNAINDLSISGSGSGSGFVSDDVRFLDYDGTILYSYSATDFANLSAMPANPTHTGLTPQGWNWSLADAKTYVATYGKLDIGQMYITDDGKTRVYISLVDSARLSPYLGICPNGTVVVDWGDNTTTATLTGNNVTTVQRVQHTYASTGDYVITLTASSGNFHISGSGSSTNGSYLLTRTNGNIISQRCYQNAIQKVELGANVTIGAYAFSNCYSLSSITIPSSSTGTGTNAFNNCYSLSSITLPSGTKSVSNYAFSYCYSLSSIALPSSLTGTGIGTYAFSFCFSLASVTIPSGVTSIGNYAFQNCFSLSCIKLPSTVAIIGSYVFQTCYSLPSITIPSRVTSIASSVFYNCYGVAEYHFLRTTPPTLSNTNAFTGILTDCKIYVPSASLTAYQTATNWSTYASYMIGE